MKEGYRNGDQRRPMVTKNDFTFTFLYRTSLPTPVRMLASSSVPLMPGARNENTQEAKNRYGLLKPAEQFCG